MKCKVLAIISTLSITLGLLFYSQQPWRLLNRAVFIYHQALSFDSASFASWLWSADGHFNHQQNTDREEALYSSEAETNCIPCGGQQFDFTSTMSAHARKVEVAGIPNIANDEEWAECLERDGVTVIDIYANWAGPCEPMQGIFKRLRIEYGEDIQFATAATGSLQVLEQFRDKSCPTFLFFLDGTLVSLIKGANAPLIERTIRELIEAERSGAPVQPLVIPELPSGKSEDAPRQSTSARPLSHHGRPTAYEHHDNVDHPARALAPHNVNEHPAAPMERARSSLILAPAQPTELSADRTLALIKPDGMAPNIIVEIADIIRRNRFEVVQKKKIWLTPSQVEDLYREHEKQNYFQGVITYLSSAPVLALELAKDNAVEEWRKVMGPSSTARAREHHPSSIRALYGTDSRINAVYGSSTVEAAKNELDLIFGPDSHVMELPFNVRNLTPPFPAQPEKTLAIIKPNVKDGALEEIVERIVCRGYQVVKREVVQLTVDQASELYSHQKDMPYFVDTINYMASGSVTALVLKGHDVITGWREMIGPTDPDVAREQFPMSIRALFGTDTVRNAVHGSDTPENARREIGQVFPSILMRAESAVFGTRAGTAAGGSRYDLSARAATAGGDHGSLAERTLALIKPDAYNTGKKDEIMRRIRDDGFKVIAEQEIEMTDQMAREFYKEHEGKQFFKDLVDWMSSLPAYAMVLEKDSAIAAWRQLAGPTNAIKAKEIAPQSIRALYGTDGSRNAVHGSDSPGSAEREIRIIFGDAVSANPEPTVSAMGTGPTHIVRLDSSVAPTTDTERTLALIKPDAYGSGKKDEIVQRVKDEGFTIVKEAEVQWTPEKAQEFYAEHEGKSFYEDLVAWMSSSPIYAMVLEKEDAIKEWRRLAGPTNSNAARESAPRSIRALYGTDGSKNAVHGSDSPASAVREINVVFGNQVSPLGEDRKVVSLAPVARPVQRTLAIIKPDAHGAGRRNAIVDRILEHGFKVIRQEQIQLTVERAGEFYREHASRPFYEELVAWMSSGPVYAMVLEKEDAVTEWRELAGPTDSEVARKTAPNSIRALYGTDKFRNAVQGSDSPVSAAREIKLLFPDESVEMNIQTGQAATVSGVPIQRTLALVKPDAYPQRLPDILNRIKQAEFDVIAQQEVLLAPEVAAEFYVEHKGRPFYDDLVRWMSR
ncbi:nucleoside diphosphate kinase [Gaertneriomyces semiglobifer]|nr:nucleoside diphosphate kinase [Gaertneriomyces semiglobifer]